MKTNLYFLVLSFFLQANLGSVWAEPISEYRPEVTFTLLAWETPLKDVWYEDDGQEYKLDLKPFERSGSYTHTGAGPLVFYRYQVGPNGGRIRQDLASIKLDRGCGRVLLILFSKDDNSLGVKKLSEDESALSLGSARIINMSAYPIAVQTQESKLQLASGESQEVKGNGRILPLKIAYQALGKWRVACSNVFLLDDQTRRTVFVASSQSDLLTAQAQDGSRIRRVLQVFSITD